MAPKRPFEGAKPPEPPATTAKIASPSVTKRALGDEPEARDSPTKKNQDWLSTSDGARC